MSKRKYLYYDCDNCAADKPVQLDGYCPLCEFSTHRGKIEISLEDDEWFLITSRDELRDLWFKYLGEHCGTYDNYSEPSRYPCLAMPYGFCGGDGWGSGFRFLYLPQAKNLVDHINSMSTQPTPAELKASIQRHVEQSSESVKNIPPHHRTILSVHETSI